MEKNGGKQKETKSWLLPQNRWCSEMTFANTQENRKKPLLFSPFFFFGQIRHLQLKIFLICCRRKSMSNFLRGQSRDQTKKSQQKIPGQEILQFSFNVNFQAKNLSSALGSKVWWDYKEWNHLIPNSVWYGFYFSVCSVFSREREWKNNLNCSITQKRIVPSWFSISIRIDANRLLLLLLPFQASVRPFRGKWDLNLNCKVRREKRWKSAIPFCIATATVFSNNDHVLFQHNHHFLGKFGPI